MQIACELIQVYISLFSLPNRNTAKTAKALWLSNILLVACNIEAKKQPISAEHHQYLFNLMWFFMRMCDNGDWRRLQKKKEPRSIIIMHENGVYESVKR